MARIDVMGALKERKAKAAIKVARAEKALESAPKELSDVLAAERVMAEITGESPDNRPSETPVSERDIAIARLIPIGPDRPMSPAELHPLYVDETGDKLSLETFRTAIWRLLKKVIRGTEKAWIVKSENGKYWREPFIDFPEQDAPEDDNDDPY